MKACRPSVHSFRLSWRRFLFDAIVRPCASSSEWQSLVRLDVPAHPAYMMRVQRTRQSQLNPALRHAGYASDRRNRLAEAWDELAGAPSLHAAALPRGGLCADAAVLGANAAGLDVVPLDAYATDADARALRPGLRAFRAWALARLRLPPGAPWAARRRARGRLALTLVDRGAAAKRRLVDQGTVAAAARARGFVVSIVDFERMALREQLDVLRATDVLLGVHGGALPLVLFLPRGAVRAAAGACMLAMECRFDSIIADCSLTHSHVLGCAAR